MASSEQLLMIVALQIALYGLGWLGAVLYLRESTAAYRDIFGFSLATALGIALLSLRGYVPDTASRTVANLSICLGLVLLWRGVAALWAVHVSPWLMYVVPGVLAAVIVWSGFVLQNFQLRVSALFLCCAWVAAAGAISVLRPMRAEFGRLAAALFGISGVSVGVVLVVRTLHAWASDVTRELDLSLPGNFVPVAVLLGAVALVNFALAFGVVARMVRRLDHLSRHDALTGLLNRRAFMEALAAEWQRHQRRERRFAVLALDIDHFKRINDDHGHATGDEVLRRLGALFGTTLRRTDVVGRIGGEEFAVLLIDTDHDSALRSAERLRTAVIAEAWPDAVAARGGVTISLGLALAGRDDRLASELLARADVALYRAKHEGRNRVAHAE